MNHSPSNGTKIKKAFLIVGLALLVVCGLGGTLFSRTDFGVAASKYESNKKEWERLGLLSTTQEYLAMIAVDSSKNAGPDLKAFVADKDTMGLFNDVLLGDPAAVKARLAGKPIPRTTRSPGRSKPSNSEMISVSKLQGRKLSQAIDSLDKMTQRPNCVVPRDYSNFLNVAFPEYSYTKNLVKVLAVLAEGSLDRGEAKDAVRLYRIGARICTWQDDEATMIGVLVRIASTAILNQSLKASIEKHASNREFVLAMPGLVSLIRQPYDIERTLKTEGVFAREAVRLVESTGIEGVVYSSGAGISSEMRLLNAGFKIPAIRKAFVSRTYEPYILAMQNQPKDKTDYRGWGSAYAAMDSIGRIPTNEKPSYTLVQFIMPVFSEFVKSVIRIQGDCAVLAQAIAAAEYRLKTGKLPNRPLLTGKDGKDGDGTNLGFSNRDGFLIWSKGRNGTDDRGVFDSKAKKDDFGIRLR